MTSQSDLAMRFMHGATSGTASNVQIVDRDDETLLVGYGWAVYAARDKDTGRLTYYEGWRGYSVSTSCALTKMGLAVKADETSDERREI